ncbi:TPA: hypothetical protein OUB89_000975 [Proteus mirabilis]|uniref:hypothetical protein n=1 Tax=Proteus mirabilis TaxID=584 RepID=UPI0015815F3B|nr:hypothetical protein [Proteus mirabilis]MBG2815429.1 hypothetical protein [Proteus mirabilis]MBG2863954.1 hypothetical protein [Proteus mirabilis]MBL1397913.1 hypothetical protein [Proteus mirabilis]MCL8565466.1 hypothetical protein [Proteus mirabilis]MCL8627055.1 hypothetical protein [Proteus mirabilis]
MTELIDSKKFSIFYDAEDNGFSNHKMNAYDLGTSIVEIAKMMYKADEILNGNNKSIELQVTAPAREGSFAIDFLVKYFNDKSVDVLKYLGFSEESSSLKFGDALTLAKSLKGERIISVITETGSDVAKLELDGREVTCDKLVAKLVSNPDIRQAMNEVITQPLMGKNSPVFRVEVNDKEVLKIENTDTQEFTPLPKNSLNHVASKVVTANITITQVNFESQNGWKMRYDDKERAVKMADESFLKRVNDNTKSFTKGDMLEVELEIADKTTARSERTQYTIIRVIRHRAIAERKLV